MAQRIVRVVPLVLVFFVLFFVPSGHCSQEALKELNTVVTRICEISDVYFDAYTNTVQSWEGPRPTVDQWLYKSKDMAEQCKTIVSAIKPDTRSNTELRDAFRTYVETLGADIQMTIEAFDALDKEKPNWRQVDESVKRTTIHLNAVWPLVKKFGLTCQQEYPELMAEMLPIALFYIRQDEFANVPMLGFEPYLARRSVIIRAPREGAQEATGLKKHDRIIGARDQEQFVKFRTIIDYFEFLKKKQAEDEVVFVIMRDNAEMDLPIRLRQRT